MEDALPPLVLHTSNEKSNHMVNENHEQLHVVCLLLVTYFDAFERLVLAEILDCADLLHNIINEVTIIHGVLNYHSYQKKVFSCTVLVLKLKFMYFYIGHMVLRLSIQYIPRVQVLCACPLKQHLNKSVYKKLHTIHMLVLSPFSGHHTKCSGVRRPYTVSGLSSHFQ